MKKIVGQFHDMRELKLLPFKLEFDLFYNAVYVI